MKKKLNSQTWIQILRGAHRQRRHWQWTVGDALNEMSELENESSGARGRNYFWQQASDVSGMPINSLMQYAKVAAVFPAKQRIRDVSFSSYQAIAGLKSPMKRRWLITKAAQDGLSCEQVRQIVQKLQKKQSKSPTKRLTVQITVDAYSKLRNEAIQRNTTVRKLAAALLYEMSMRGGKP